MRIALGLEYDGSNYWGWQRQPHLPTLQSVVELALTKVANHAVTVSVAGRTDAGVHALGQVIHFDTHAVRNLDAWVLGTNSNLPPAIRVHWAVAVTNAFHARHAAIARQYRYLIYNDKAGSALLHQRVLHVPQPLDIELMQEAAHYLLGEHDFSALRGSGCEAKTPIRYLETLKIVRERHIISLDVKANAFLLHMVRNIVGVLLVVGNKKRPPIWVQEVLQSRDRKQAATTAAPHGLYLYRVYYAHPIAR